MATKKKPELLIGDLEAIEADLRRLARADHARFGQTKFTQRLFENADWLERVISRAKGA